MKRHHAQTLSALALAAAVLAAPLAVSAAPLAPTAQATSQAPAAHQQKTAFHGQQHLRWNHHRQARHGGGWMHKLNLTQDQKDQIFKIRHDQAPAIYDQKKALRVAAKALREQGRADSFDATKAQQAADAFGQAQGKLALMRAETAAQIRAVLTPEQRAKLTQHHTKRGASASAES